MRYQFQETGFCALRPHLYDCNFDWIWSCIWDTWDIISDLEDSRSLLYGSKPVLVACYGDSSYPVDCHRCGQFAESVSYILLAILITGPLNGFADSGWSGLRTS